MDEEIKSKVNIKGLKKGGYFLEAEIEDLENEVKELNNKTRELDDEITELENKLEKIMGEIADMMLGGAMCEMCGEYLECDECEDVGIPKYCSMECAKDRGASKEQVCEH